MDLWITQRKELVFVVASVCTFFASLAIELGRWRDFYRSRDLCLVKLVLFEFKKNYISVRQWAASPVRKQRPNFRRWHWMILKRYGIVVCYFLAFYLVQELYNLFGMWKDYISFLGTPECDIDGVQDYFEKFKSQVKVSLSFRFVLFCFYLLLFVACIWIFSVHKPTSKTLSIFWYCYCRCWTPFQTFRLIIHSTQIVSKGFGDNIKKIRTLSQLNISHETEQTEAIVQREVADDVCFYFIFCYFYLFLFTHKMRYTPQLLGKLKGIQEKLSLMREQENSC